MPTIPHRDPGRNLATIRIRHPDEISISDDAADSQSIAADLDVLFSKYGSGDIDPIASV
jgi:hypothetical protein